LCAGFCSAGVDTYALAVVPTGGISWIARTQGFDLGIVISASHNPAEDNGIKLIGPDGRKAPESLERWIEEHVDDEITDRPLLEAVGQIYSRRHEVMLYSDWLTTLVPERLDGMKIVMDCAHGAAFEVAPTVFRALGAELTIIGDDPNGVNINEEGGATKPSVVQALTQELGADLGISFDGDADRAVFSDSKGRLINGDRTMAIWAQHWRHEGRLDPAIVVGTVMSNMGFENYLKGEGITLERVDVGDKYVSAKLNETGAQVGGEQSGHIIFPESGPTGDGLATALHLARVMKREGKTAAELYDSFDNWPQVLVNVKVANKEGWDSDPAVVSALATANGHMEGNGRINVRASGTQPIVRVMVESSSVTTRDTVAKSVVDALLAARGGEVYSTVDLTHSLGE
ncbi:MAG: phosphoglucosamine mutase, partial [Armatimonadota bacterium]